MHYHLYFAVSVGLWGWELGHVVLVRLKKKSDEPKRNLNHQPPNNTNVIVHYLVLYRLPNARH